MSFIVLLGIMFILTVLGLPLFYSIIFASIVTLFMFLPYVPVTIVAQQVMQGLDTNALQALAFFFLAGELMSVGGITSRIIRFVTSLIGRWKGSLAYINIFSSLFFGSISGSAVASTAAIGSSLIPEMKKNGYPAPFAAALTQSASIIGPIIPPSVPMIVFAALAGAGVSVGKMFMSGIIPGIMIALILILVTLILSKIYKYGNKSVEFNLKEVKDSAKDAVWALLCPIIILYGIISGVFTATEAGAVSVVYAYLVGTFIYKELSIERLKKALISSLKGTVTVMLIVGASSIFAWIIARLQISHQVAAWISSICDHPLEALILINIIVLFIGMVMDPTAALTILVPVFMPIVSQFGIDPIHFGLVIILNLMIGLVTPPVGYLIFLSANIAECEPMKVLKASLPYLLALFALLILLIIVPEFSTFLPNLFFA
ncbi:TRAP transporter large permease [Rodentibacter trehalosifermentans]|uniref:TRAP transporter large permease protein n=1 Tax=Rodentibacter trehalosifermentans TaxID=1908263 RepID=A0A1V3J2E9_9PAST|nr:TRAP transporter large permease [Rodentibacter trehalosifermentans]OOF43605.1 C4-dicarboxylate ABC transporter permease [Rodentibacter trehalosifermentans]OOF48849.1 C4-dicarboxylate ABC transporter permease [Rodentibacter trehalosifermentans]OOF51382.1 C4-dicarboxylate ABC transporter permease [Rodentibacter trehalosifermentans]